MFYISQGDRIGAICILRNNRKPEYSDKAWRQEEDLDWLVGIK
jgi:hypothetical protein